MLHNFWLTNFSLLFAADLQANPTDISCKKYWKTSQSKIMQHCSYLGCPLVKVTFFSEKYWCLIVRSSNFAIKNCLRNFSGTFLWLAKSSQTVAAPRCGDLMSSASEYMYSENSHFTINKSKHACYLTTSILVWPLCDIL